MPDVAEKCLGTETTYEISITFLLIRKRVWVVAFPHPPVNTKLENRRQQHSFFFFFYLSSLPSPPSPILIGILSKLGIVLGMLCLK